MFSGKRLNAMRSHTVWTLALPPNTFYVAYNWPISVRERGKNAQQNN